LGLRGNPMRFLQAKPPSDVVALKTQELATADRARALLRSGGFEPNLLSASTPLSSESAKLRLGDLPEKLY
jgi:hypothetical protein